MRFIKFIKSLLYGILAMTIFFEFQLNSFVLSKSYEFGVDTNVILSEVEDVGFVMIKLSTNIIWLTIVIAVIEALQNLYEAIVIKSKKEK